MSATDLVFVTAYTVSAVAGLTLCVFVVRTAGRDRPSDPEGVRRFIETALRYHTKDPDELPPISTGQSGMTMEGSSLCLRTCSCPTTISAGSR